MMLSVVVIVVPNRYRIGYFVGKAALPVCIVCLKGEVIGMPGCQGCNRILQHIARINFGCRICQDALLTIEYFIAGDRIRAWIPGRVTFAA